MNTIYQDHDQQAVSSTVFTISEVNERGLCVGCGACALVDENVKISRNKLGEMYADLSSIPKLNESLANKVCPFSDSSQNEDVVGKQLFNDCVGYEARVGFYNGIYYGRRLDENILMNSSSGGLTSLVAEELLKQGHVDGIIHVGKNSSADNDALFSFVTSYSVEEASKNKKSQYYSLSFENVLKEVRGDGKRYVFVGVPCFVKAIRNLCIVDKELNQQIRFTLGLVCGHLKSSAFAEMLSWQLGVKPDSIKAVDFRKKNKNKTVNAYDFMVTDISGQSHAKTSTTMFAGGWGYATFQLEGCNYCDDIFAETADAVFGDAWLPQFNTYWQGTNIVLVRNKIIDSILKAAELESRIELGDLSVDELCQSQQGNFRHRREGLIVRLNDDIHAGLPVPRKRVDINDVQKLDPKRIEIARFRKFLAQQSHKFFQEAKHADDYQIFFDSMAPLVQRMDNFYKLSLFKKIIRKIKRVYRAIMKNN